MLAFRLAWRNFKSGELKLLASGLFLAVAVVGAVAVFTDRLDNTLTRQSNSLLGADQILNSSRPISPEWVNKASELGVMHTQSVRFSSMVFTNNGMNLASINAVEQAYPLRGHVEVSTTAFATETDAIHVAQGVPAPGEVWVDSRLLPLLDIKLGQMLTIGEADFKATHVVIQEPGSGNPFSLMGVGLMMNAVDLPKTEVLQPGSRVQYRWLLAAKEQTLESFLTWLKPQLSEHESLVDINSNQQGVSRTLTTARQFLLLAAVMGVLLAGIAIAMAARQFAVRHTDQVALLKSFGISANRLRKLYLGQLIFIASVASLLGLAAGEALQQFIAFNVQHSFQIQLQPAHVQPYALSVLCGFICLACFALPALWHLPAVSPLKILRRELNVTHSRLYTQGFFALVAVTFLTALFSQNYSLTLSVLGAIATVVLVIAALSFLFLISVKNITGHAGSIWRLALANLQRRVEQTLVQLAVFSLAILLLLSLIITRTTLISEWQQQVPEDAPNHFLANIGAHEVADLTGLLDAQGFAREQLYPMVRGRLLKINDVEVSKEQRKKHGGINREANLTWTHTLASDNKVVQGDWWPTWEKQKNTMPGISVEEELAAAVGIKLGDKLTFSIGGLEAQGVVSSIRTLDWRSMKPNFFFIFEPGALDEFSPMYMTSFYLPTDKKLFINTLLQNYPTVMVVELDKIIAQIQTIVQQTSNGVLLVLLLILSGGALVMLSAVTSSLAERKQEVGLLRALGISRKLLLGSMWVEFSLVGLIAGLVATVGAEALLISLQIFVFETAIKPHYIYWLLTPALSAVLIGGLGTYSCRRIIQTPPGTVLREAA